MRTNYQYEELIREKLQQLAPPDVNDLWNRMENVLDAEMPVEKSKRPVPFLLSSSAITMFIAASIFIAFIINKSASTPSKEAIETKRETTLNNNQSSNHKISNSNNTIEKNNSTLFITPAPSNTNNDISAAEQNKSLPFVVANNNNNSFSQVNSINHTDQPYTNKILASDYDNMSETVNHKNTIEFLQGREWNNDLVLATDKQAVATPFLSTQPKTYNNRHPWMNKVVAGVSFNYNVPVAGQQVNSFNYNNRSTAVFDYLPSIFIQYHFSKKFSLEAEAQFVSPQHSTNQTVYNRVDQLNADEKNIDVFTLNKAYYMNVPVAIHFTPTPHFTIGAGVQVSQLKQLVLTEDQYYSFKSRGTWNTSLTSSDMVVKAPPTSTEKANMTTSADSVAASFKRTDLRMNLEAGYNVGRFNIGARYTAGFNNASDNKISPNAIPAGKNQSLQLFVKINLFDKRKF